MGVINWLMANYKFSTQRWKWADFFFSFSFEKKFPFFFFLLFSLLWLLFPVLCLICRNSLLLLSTVTMMHRIVEHKSAFLSPYLSDILQYVSLFCFSSNFWFLPIWLEVSDLYVGRGGGALGKRDTDIISTYIVFYEFFYF